MGTTCAWCDSILHGCGSSERRISHTICRGCLEELKLTLTSQGLRLSEADEATPLASAQAA
jgi:hypothetical protein